MGKSGVAIVSPLDNERFETRFRLTAGTAGVRIWSRRSGGLDDLGQVLLSARGDRIAAFAVVGGVGGGGVVSYRGIAFRDRCFQIAAFAAVAVQGSYDPRLPPGATCCRSSAAL